MMRTTVTALAVATATMALAACTYNEPPGGAPMALVNGAGQTIGSVTAYQSGGGVTLHVNARLPHGVHGIHIHSVGRCDGPDFTTAGPHWNPGGRQHGFSNPNGAHHGDLSNVTVSANGALVQTIILPNADITQVTSAPGALLDMDGAALVIHANADDYVTDPSGNSGARIACAVLVPTSVRY